VRCEQRPRNGRKGGGRGRPGKRGFLAAERKTRGGSGSGKKKKNGHTGVEERRLRVELLARWGDITQSHKRESYVRKGTCNNSFVPCEYFIFGFVGGSLEVQSWDRLFSVL